MQPSPTDSNPAASPAPAESPRTGAGGAGPVFTPLTVDDEAAAVPVVPTTEPPADEERPVLPSDAEQPTDAPPIPRALAARLYTSHVLSTWNARVFEFAAVLFLAAIFPDTLLPLSVYAVVRGVAALFGAEAVGACIDRGDRLAVVRASIVGQRVAVVVSAGVFWVMARSTTTTTTTTPHLTDGLFALAVAAACVEKLCSVMNLVAVERDWVVVITEGNEGGRRLLNARMRRIDLFCKLAGPLAISFVAAASTQAAIWVVLGTNAVSVAVEYFCIAVVYRRVPGLQQRRLAWREETAPGGVRSRAPSPVSVFVSGLRAVTRRVLPFASLPFYVRHPAFVPSFALSVLYLTVLSFSGQMVTYLLAVGYSARAVGLVRTASTLLELSATWLAPRLMARIGVVRGGIWSLSWQSVWLTAGVAWFFAGGSVFGPTTAGSGSGGSTATISAATGLAVGVALSRVGLWGYDLCAQNIVQDEVPFDHRGAFSTAEAALQNLFEVLSYVATIVFSRPDQFKWPVVISAGAVYTAAALYTGFVRHRRGHLFHSPLPPAQRWLEKRFSRRHA
ncbi:Ferroporti-1 [Niveomyces insectorum RCEF 264]|uniref:Solute carrier family 40 member n=1 Tax=Niveomyces insectorum RCEF 264 TaxID=1081102 RepID=A0A167SP68_9HYPO|nr:Ferroporti-1 [Niveomyces insectorum RCEF 264]